MVEDLVLLGIPIILSLLPILKKKSFRGNSKRSCEIWITYCNDLHSFCKQLALFRNMLASNMLQVRKQVVDTTGT